MDNERIIYALKMLKTEKAKVAFITMVNMFPECSIFWTEDSAIIENDDIKIEITN